MSLSKFDYGWDYYWNDCLSWSSSFCELKWVLQNFKNCFKLCLNFWKIKLDSSVQERRIWCWEEDSKSKSSILQHDLLLWFYFTFGWVNMQNYYLTAADITSKKYHFLTSFYKIAWVLWKKKKIRQNDFQCKKNKEPTAACCFHEIFFLVKLFVVVLFLTIFESHCSFDGKIGITFLFIILWRVVTVISSRILFQKDNIPYNYHSRKKKILKCV